MRHADRKTDDPRATASRVSGAVTTSAKGGTRSAPSVLPLTLFSNTMTDETFWALHAGGSR